ncbi:MAG TPA: BatA domain-containing protein [Verrucomicrobiae bacterium]|nr:BatA domain-containing protein [Verrucomicrobiae bacterium]
MSFLNETLMSVLIPLLALPLVIHLLNRKYPKLFAFSSVKNIRDTVARRSKLFKWRHLILLFLRTAFLILLLLAFLKPAIPKFGSTTEDKKSRHVLLMFDHSLSMEYKGEGVSCRQRAMAEAEKIIRTLGPDDFINIVLVEQSPSTCFVEFSRNQAEARQYVSGLKPGLTRADFNQANGVASRLMAKDLSRPEIYYLSDFQRKNWASVDFTALPASARLFFVDVSSGKKDNHAILGASINQSEVLAGDTVMLEVSVGNYSAQPLQERLTAVLDQRTTFEKDVFVAPWSVGKVLLPVTPGAPGAHQCEIRLPPDGLEQDDQFHLTIPVLEKEEVLIISDDPHPEKDAVYFLQTALNPYDKLQGSLLPRHIVSAEVNPAQLASAKKIFLTRAGRLSDEACAAVAKFLFGGGGVIYFLDGQSDADNLQRLEKVMGPGTMPIKLADRRVAENLTAGVQVIKGDFKSKYLKLFRGSTRQDLALLEFYDFYHASSTGAGNILLTYADETPAMASVGHGLGTMLLLNFSVSEFSSNLARQKIFPAWIQELVKAISSDESPPEAYVVGENIQTEVWRSDLKDNGFASPSGKMVEIKREAMGERYGITFVPAELGFYTLRSARATYSFGVNPSPDESDLRQVDKQLLPDSLKEGQQAHFVAGQEDYENLVLGRPIFHYFVFAGLILLILELGFQLLIKRLAA